MLHRLRPLLDHLRGHPNRTGRQLARARSNHMLNRLTPCSQIPSSADIRPLCISFAPGFEEALAGLVGYEEERGAGGGANDSGANARIDTAKAAGGIEAAGGL